MSESNYFEYFAISGPQNMFNHKIWTIDSLVIIFLKKTLKQSNFEVLSHGYP
jgi:hypothetical protein